MKDRLKYKFEIEGFTNWDDPKLEEDMEKRMRMKASSYPCQEKEFLDIANFAMFLWNMNCT